MKKWIAALAAILLLSCPMTAFAAEADINQVPGNQGIEVYGSCQSSKDYYEIMLGVNGMDTVDLPDDVMLSGKSDSEADNGLRVVIIPVTADEEAEAYAWMASVSSKMGKEPAAYYLAFYRGSTPVQPEGKVTVTMTAKDGYEKAKLCYMDGNANAKDVPYTTEQGNASFGMEQTGYYLFLKTEGSSQPTEPVDPDDPSNPTEPIDPDDPNRPTTPTAPQTGDNSNLWLWITLLLLSGTLLVGTTVYGRKKMEL